MYLYLHYSHVVYQRQNVNSSETWQFAEFFLSVLLKTMVLHLYKNGKLGTS
jgi:hypothetical protein